MNIEQLELRGFMAHGKTSITLPQRGVVLLTGANGSGKSTLVEAVSVGLWGKTLRGTDPWSSPKGGLLVSTREGLRVDRLPKRLSFSDGAAAPVAYETNTKAQEALAKVVGAWDVWRRSCVFSSADAAHFTLATDGQRKELLEEMLGMGRFAGALKRANDEARKANAEQAKAHADVRVIAERLAAARRQVAAADAMLRTAPAGPTPEEINEFKEARREHEALLAGDFAAVQGALERSGQELATARAAEAAAQRAFREAARQGADCSMCGRPYDDAEARKTAQERAAADLKAATQALDFAHAARNKAVHEHGQVNMRVAWLKKRMDDIKAKHGAFKAAQASMTQARIQLAAGDADVRALEEELEELEMLDKRLCREAALWEATTRVLGLKGVRAHLLGQATTSLETVANAWLSSLAGNGLSLKLSPYTENKTGGVSDRLSLEVQGAGGGHGYRGASGGERRRIDVAMLLALGQMAAAAHGREQGTLFFDEVFDALDGDGIERVVSVVRELSERRCCVVISHSAELAARLDPVKHYRASAGQLVAV